MSNKKDQSCTRQSRARHGRSRGIGRPAKRLAGPMSEVALLTPGTHSAASSSAVVKRSSSGWLERQSSIQAVPADSAARQSPVKYACDMRPALILVNNAGARPFRTFLRSATLEEM